MQVKAAAVEAGTATFKLVGNRDIEHLVHDLLHCVTRPNEVSDVVTKLSATTFVQVRPVTCGVPVARGGGAVGGAAAAMGCCLRCLQLLCPPHKHKGSNLKRSLTLLVLLPTAAGSRRSRRLRWR